MEHYDFIFLLISSDDLPCYAAMRDYQAKYFNLYKDKIKLFFIEFKDVPDTVIEGNYIYVPGTEHFYPGMYHKTMKAMEYINSHYNYEFVIRSNLSSFWNLNHLIDLKPSLPIHNFAGGSMVTTVLPEPYISGTSIILSKDTCTTLTTVYSPTISYYEDICISFILVSLGYVFSDIKNYNYDIAVNELKYGNILYYRLKQHDRNDDLILFEALMKTIYGL